MAKILHIRSVNDYARYVGAPVLHELVSVIHYDELTAMRHSLNSYEVYAMFLNDGELPELTYGTVQYTMPQHTLMCVSPGQISRRRKGCRPSVTAPRNCVSPPAISAIWCAKRQAIPP